MSKMDGLPGNHSEHVSFVVKNDYKLFRRGRERYCKIGSGEGHLNRIGRSLPRSAWFLDLVDGSYR